MYGCTYSTSYEIVRKMELVTDTASYSFADADHYLRCRGSKDAMSIYTLGRSWRCQTKQEMEMDASTRRRRSFAL